MSVQLQDPGTNQVEVTLHPAQYWELSNCGVNKEGPLHVLKTIKDWNAKFLAARWDLAVLSPAGRLVLLRRASGYTGASFVGLGNGRSAASAFAIAAIVRRFGFIADILPLYRQLRKGLPPEHDIAYTRRWDAEPRIATPTEEPRDAGPFTFDNITLLMFCKPEWPPYRTANFQCQRRHQQRANNQRI